MPRKQELTAVKVLDYFGTAPYEAAVLVLQLAGQAVKMRAPKVPEKGGKKKDPAATNAAVDAATRSSVGQGAVPSSAGTTPAGQTGQAPPASPRARRQTASASQPATASQTTAATPPAAGTTTTAPTGQTDGLPGMATV